MTKEEALASVRQEHMSLGDLPEEFRNDKDVVLAAINQGGFAIKYASTQLWSNREFIKMLLREAEKRRDADSDVNFPSAEWDESDYVEFFGPDYFNDHPSETFESWEAKRAEEINERESDSDAGQENIPRNRVYANTVIPFMNFLTYISNDLWDDEVFAREIILDSSNMGIGSVFQFAPLKLQNDYNLVLSLVKINGSELEYASDNLKNNKQIVLEAVENYPEAIQHASKALRNNVDVINSSRNAAQRRADDIAAPPQYP